MTNTELLKELPPKLFKKILLEELFLLGMQAQSQRMTSSEGMGYFDSSELNESIRRNKEEKIKIINILTK